MSRQIAVADEFIIGTDRADTEVFAEVVGAFGLLLTASTFEFCLGTVAHLRRRIMSQQCSLKDK